VLGSVVANYYYIRSPRPFILYVLGTYYILKPANNTLRLSTLKFSLEFIRLFLVKSIRFTFSGKGYRMYTDTNALSFTFGHSHLFYVYFFSSPLHLTAKTRGFLTGLNVFNLQSLSILLLNTKPLNIFTWRGLRLKPR
jgi:hypothetical protein